MTGEGKSVHVVYRSEHQPQRTQTSIKPTHIPACVAAAIDRVSCSMASIRRFRLPNGD